MAACVSLQYITHCVPLSLIGPKGTQFSGLGTGSHVFNVKIIGNDTNCTANETFEVTLGPCANKTVGNVNGEKTLTFSKYILILTVGTVINIYIYKTYEYIQSIER